MTRGGTLEEIYLQDIEMDSVKTFIEVSMIWNPSYSYTKSPKEYDIDSVPSMANSSKEIRTQVERNPHF
ncbi:hypothetical protein DET49_103164 [Salegentibacter sp. 24]|uniref:hypothetical protein n=1 Tax=Salegentibacter sp. 24 TaxID=2183986 RepID=UPI001060DF08|nr:hypothetical protein [Salegentibacter sp. 24]TDN95098.1 hypothetical protein DET49_103164 [Salegentibacter sp. 24]